MSQKDIVLKHLKNRPTLDTFEANDKYNISRLGAVIHKLKRSGYEIETTYARSPQGGFYAIYSLFGN